MKKRGSVSKVSVNKRLKVSPTRYSKPLDDLLAAFGADCRAYTGVGLNALLWYIFRELFTVLGWELYYLEVAMPLGNC